MKLFKKKQQKIKEKINLKYILISGIAFGLCFPPIPFPFFLFFAIENYKRGKIQKTPQPPNLSDICSEFSG